MGKSGGAPNPPDFMGAAGLQGYLAQQLGREQLIANRPNTSTPFGFQRWSTSPIGPGGAPGGKGGASPGAPGATPGAPPGGGPGGGKMSSSGIPAMNWTMESGLSPELSTAAGNIQNQIATQSGTPIPTGEQGRQAAISQISSFGRSRLDPMFQQRQAALDSNLVNQGLDPNTSPIGQTAEAQLGRERTDAYTGLEEMAQRTGREAQQQMFGQELAGRALPYQQAGGLAGLMQQPGFNPAQMAPPPNYLGGAEALSQANMQGYGANQGKKGSTIGGLGALGGGIAIAV